MRLDEYFSQPISDVFDPKGKETDWLDFGTLEVSSGRIAVGDNTFFPDKQLELDMPCGTYTIRAKVRDFGTDRRISRLRSFQAKAPLVARLLGEISVGFNSVSICDPVTFLAALLKHTDDGQNLELIHSLFWDRLNESFGIITFLEDPPATMAFVRCGWGAGHYEVFELMSDTTRIGIETIFIDPQEPYFFQNVSEFDIL